jgi:hypothetical protein
MIALIGGRIAALLGLAAASFVAFMASSWLARNELSDWSLSVIGWSHAQVLAVTWSLALYVARHSASGRNRRHEWEVEDALTVPVRLLLIRRAPSGSLALRGSDGAGLRFPGR